MRTRTDKCSTVTWTKEHLGQCRYTNMYYDLPKWFMCVWQTLLTEPSLPDKLVSWQETVVIFPFSLLG